MKKLIKKNILFILVTIIAGGYIGYCVHKTYHFFVEEDKHYLILQEKLKNGELKEGDVLYNVATEVYRPYMPDKVNLFLRIFSNDDAYEKFWHIYPIFMLCLGGYSLHKNLKSGNIKNELTRETYEKYKKKQLCNAYKYALILPLILTIVVIFLNCVHTSEAKEILKWSSEGYPWTIVGYDVYGMKNWFFVFYIGGVFCYSIFLINLSLIFTLNSRYYAPSVFLSYGFYFILNIFFEAFLGPLLVYILDINYLPRILMFENFRGCVEYGKELYCFSFYSLTLLLASTALVLFLYRKKERVLTAHGV